MKVTTSSKLLSIPKFAACFGVSDYYVRAMVQAGTIRQVNIPGVLSRHPRFSVAELMRFKEESGLPVTPAYWDAIRQPVPEPVEEVKVINGVDVPEGALVLMECPTCASGIRWKCVRAGNTFDSPDSLVGAGVTMHDAWQSLLVQEQQAEKKQTTDRWSEVKSRRELQSIE